MHWEVALKPCKKNSNSAGLGKAFRMEGCQTRTKLKHLFSATFKQWYLVGFIYQCSQVKSNVHCDLSAYVKHFHLSQIFIASDSHDHDRGKNGDLRKLAITPLDILVKTWGNLANNHDDLALYSNLNDKTIHTYPGYAWMMNSVSFAVTCLAFNLSMTQYVLQCIDSLSTSPCNISTTFGRTGGKGWEGRLFKINNAKKWCSILIHFSYHHNCLCLCFLVHCLVQPSPKMTEAARKKNQIIILFRGPNL